MAENGEDIEANSSLAGPKPCGNVRSAFDDANDCGRWVMISC
jgi:hypothetical protein